MGSVSTTSRGVLASLWMPVAVFAVCAAAFAWRGEIVADAPEGYSGPFLALTGIAFWLSAAVLLNRILRVFLWDRVVARSIEGTVPRLLIDVTSIVVYLMAITVIVGSVFRQPLTGFWATSGVVGLVLGLALRNIILDLFTGVAVNIDRPYRVGDWIQVHERVPEQNIVGRIIEINWRTSRLRTEDGNMVVIPNSVLGLMIVTNFEQDRNPSRFNVRLCLDFGVPSERAIRILRGAVGSVVEDPRFARTPAPDAIVRATNDMGIEYEVRFWVHPWTGGLTPNAARDIVHRAALDHLSRAGIRPSYPKEDVYLGRIPAERPEPASPADRERLLGRVPLFSPLDPGERAALAARMRPAEYRAGQELIREGDSGDSMFVLAEGLLEVFSAGPDGAGEVRVGQLAPADCFGEMSLLTGENRAATVRAATDSVAYEVDRAPVADLFAARPEIAEAMSSIVAERRSLTARSLDDSTTREDSGATQAGQILERIRGFFRNVWPSRGASGGQG